MFMATQPAQRQRVSTVGGEGNKLMNQSPLLNGIE